MYLTNASDSDSHKRRSMVLKNGNESLIVNSEMVKFAAKQIGCTESEIYKYLESDEESPQKNKSMHEILMERAAKHKK